MFSGDDSTHSQVSRAERLNVIRGSMIYRESKGEVEVAVIKGSIPANADLLAAHQSPHGLGVKGFSQESQIISLLILAVQLCPKPSEGHIGDGEKTGKRDAEASAQLTPVIFFQNLLRGGQKRPSRIVDEVQGQAGF